MSLTIDFPDDLTHTLCERAKAEGVSTEEYAGELLKQALARTVSKVPLATRIREIWADMPESVRAKLPEDGATEHDHYIYGTPKRKL